MFSKFSDEIEIYDNLSVSVVYVKMGATLIQKYEKKKLKKRTKKQKKKHTTITTSHPS